MEHLLLAFELLTSPSLVAMAILGMTWGIFGGAIPGLSPSIIMALLLPFTFTMEPIPALVLLVSTYVGSEYGGSVPAILIRTPGTNSAAATAIDGYEMQKQGRGDEALGIALMSSFYGSLVGLILLICLTQPLSQVALMFHPASYAALGILGLSVIATVSEGSLTKGIIGAILGLMIATVGTDPISGVSRFTFGNPNLLGGVPIILVMVGLYAVTEVMEQASLPNWEKAKKAATWIKLPNLAMSKRLAVPNLIGVAVGVFTGLMPGAGGTVAAFMAVNEAKRFSKHPEEFGKGSPEGVAAPESANNADVAIGLVPLLSFGIPASNSTVVLLGGFLIHGLYPGPALFDRNPEILYGMFAGSLVATLALPIMAMLTLSICMRLVNQPKPYVMAFILATIFSGAYVINYSMFDLGLVLAAGVFGFGLRYFGFPQLPTVLGLVLGFLIESNYRRALLISGGDHMTFLKDPFSAVFLALSVVFLVGSLVSQFRKRRKAGQEISA